MDVEKAGYYKLYRCRSLLACDGGGIVLDTSQRFENSDGSTLGKNADKSANESSPLENIIYVIDNKDDEVKTSPASQQTLAGTRNYCLGELNNCEPCLNVNLEPKCMQDPCPSPDDNCKYYIVQCDDHDDVVVDGSQNSSLDSDSFDGENFEHYCDSIHQTSPAAAASSVEDVCVNSSTNDADNFSQDMCKSLNDFEEDENSSPLHQIVESTATKHTRKRKQSFKIKGNSFTGQIQDDYSPDASLVCENDKKSRMACNNQLKQKTKLQFQKYNPFENLKMSSILKKKGINQIQLSSCKRESFASTSDDDDDDESSELSYVSYSEQVFSERSFSSKFKSSHFPSSLHFFKIYDTFTSLNSDLTNANYLEYVQPREKICESDMDKLLSPTIEVEISTVLKHVEINQHKQKKTQLDVNENDVKLKENLNYNLNYKISASEAVEKQLVSKAVYAVQLGFQNIFNTCNECVVDEILQDDSCCYEDIQLEINLDKSAEPKIPLVLLENVNQYLTHHHQLNNPFKSVSCSLKDTLDEFKHFGGFLEDNNNNSNNKNDNNNNNNEKDEKDEKDYYNDSITFHSSFNSLVEENTGESDMMNADHESRNKVRNKSIDEKQSIAPLKMKIKRVGDDHQYIIDDSSIYNVSIDNNNKATSKFQKNPDSKYECSCCSAKFRTKRLLKSHISENHKGPYDMECEICHMKSKKSLAYKKHKPWCEKSTALKCEYCEKVYCYKAVLQRHLNTHHKDGF